METIPDWIRYMVWDMRTYSTGLDDIHVEVIPYSFYEKETAYCYAATFRLNPRKVRAEISLCGETWKMKEIGRYILTVMSITGEYTYAVGELKGEKNNRIVQGGNAL